MKSSNKFIRCERWVFRLLVNKIDFDIKCEVESNLGRLMQLKGLFIYRGYMLYSNFSSFQFYEKTYYYAGRLEMKDRKNVIKVISYVDFGRTSLLKDKVRIRGEEYSIDSPGFFVYHTTKNLPIFVCYLNKASRDYVYFSNTMASGKAKKMYEDVASGY
jgi:hypothetical protein